MNEHSFSPVHDRVLLELSARGLKESQLVQLMPERPDRVSSALKDLRSDSLVSPALSSFYGDGQPRNGSDHCPELTDAGRQRAVELRAEYERREQRLLARYPDESAVGAYGRAELVADFREAQLLIAGAFGQASRMGTIEGWISRGMGDASLLAA